MLRNSFDDAELLESVAVDVGERRAVFRVLSERVLAVTAVEVELDEARLHGDLRSTDMPPDEKHQQTTDFLELHDGWG